MSPLMNPPSLLQSKDTDINFEQQFTSPEDKPHLDDTQITTGGNDSSIADRHLSLLYPLTTDPIESRRGTPPSNSSISNVTERVQLSPDVTLPSTLLQMFRNPFIQINSPTIPNASSNTPFSATFAKARLSPIPGPSNANDLPSSNIPRDPSTNRLYHISLGHREQGSRQQGLTTRAQIKASYATYNGTDKRGV
uniref:Uncharacterized protein n=1 Tax=Moniliophthora roreri TaxID=221103 RepID=A0A0W0G228_MONRR